MLLTTFYLVQGKKIETWFEASKDYFGIIFTTFLSRKVAVSVSWCTAPASLCLFNNLQLQKRCNQKFCFEFCAFGFEGFLLVFIAYP